MEFNIVVEKDNPLFKRKEIEGTIKSEICPSKKEVTKFLSEKYSIPEENIIIETIEGRFGSREFLLVAQLYESLEARNATEVKTKKQKESQAKATEDAKAATEGVESDAPAQPQQEQVESPAESKPAEAPTEEEAKAKESLKKEVKEEKKQE